MTLHKFLLTLGIVFTLAGSFYLVVGNFKSAEDIVRISGTYWGGNLAVRVSLITARIYSIVGFTLLAIGIISQITSMFVPNKDFGMGEIVGIVLIVLGIAILLATLYVNYERFRLVRKTSKIEIMKYKMPEGATTRARIEKKFGGNFIELGRNFFLIEKMSNESLERYIHRLCKEIEEIKI